MSESKEAKSGMLRQLILFGVLFLLVIGLIYDYKVARPGVDQAYDKITEQSALVNMRSTDKFTNKDVQELLEKQPSRTFEDPNGDFVEVYSWRSGLPIRTHDLFAVYKKNGDDWLFHRHQKFKHETSTDVSKYDGKEALVVELDGESPPDPQADAARESGGAPPTGGGDADRRPNADSRPEPEAEADDAEADSESEAESDEPAEAEEAQP